MAVLQVPPIDLSYPSLGGSISSFIENRFVFGPGSLSGQQAKLDDEKRGLVYRMYELQPPQHRYGGMRRFQRAGVELRKGVAKTEFAAWICGCELHPEAPVRFDHWAEEGEVSPWGYQYYPGEPVGRPVRSPVIPMMAVTEEQVSELAFGVLKFVLENCPDDDLFEISKERIVRKAPNGTEDGFAVAVSNAPGSRDGARTSFQHFDEPHRLFMPRQRDAHETMLQNMSKRPLEDPWTLYTSTAGQPGQNSIEEDVRAEAEEIADGKREDPTLFFFARWAGQEHDDLSTVEKRIAAVADATCDQSEAVDGPVGEFGPGQYERIAKDYDRKGVDKAYWERVYLNRWRKSGSQAFNMIKVALLFVDKPIPDGAFVAAGFDGAKFRDATALVITDIQTGWQQLLGLWERPELVDEWEVPFNEVDQAVADMMARYDVWRLACDPPHWTAEVAGWAQKYPDQVIEWFTVRKRPMADAVRAYSEAIDYENDPESAQIRFSANPWREDLVRHLGNAGRKELTLLDDKGQPLWVMQKQDGRLEDKFDAGMAGCLSWTTCLEARRTNAQPRRLMYMPGRIY
ncbi:large terminase [Mycolicibacterium llatzerense]|uniref:large terminase n=1 Tax=Mycolicibacterium llatzerense TaxID=280871 RepID=UPI0021B63DEF|nr:large terminase [Mycolicibacterium llatzerense]MCT7369452.1 large terminase [Mycolicibacterium llatzerense]